MTSLYMEAAESCLNEAYEMMLKENGDDVIVAQPEINLSAVTDDYVEFKFNLTLKPEVKLGKYKGLDVKKDTVKVTKKEVSEAIEQMRQRYMENIDKEGKVAEDIVRTKLLGPGKAWALTIAPAVENGNVGIQITIDERTNDHEVDIEIPSDWL